MGEQRRSPEDSTRIRQAVVSALSNVCAIDPGQVLETLVKLAAKGV